MALSKLKELFKSDDELEVNETEDEYYKVSTQDAYKDATSAGNKMVLLEPRSVSEAQAIADHLKSRNSVVVNLKRVTSPQAKRIIDFLSGCIYAIGGNMQKIGVGIYLCTPNNVNVQGQITEDNDKGKTDRDDELEW